VASTSPANCSILLRSYYAESMEGTAITSTKKCPQKFVCPGGEASAAFDPAYPAEVSGTTVVPCPDGTFTENLGAYSTSECSECTLA